MAYREIAMWEILEVLRRVHRGEGQRAIQRVTGHGRTTIRRWVACATELGWAWAVQAPDEALLSVTELGGMHPPARVTMR